MSPCSISKLPLITVYQNNPSSPGQNTEEEREREREREGQGGREGGEREREGQGGREGGERERDVY